MLQSDSRFFFFCVNSNVAQRQDVEKSGHEVKSPSGRVDSLSQGPHVEKAKNRGNYTNCIYMHNLIRLLPFQLRDQRTVLTPMLTLIDDLSLDGREKCRCRDAQE